MESHLFTLEMSDSENKLLPTLLDNIGLKIWEVRTVAIQFYVHYSLNQSIKNIRIRNSKESISLTAATLVFYSFAQAIKKWRCLERIQQCLHKPALCSRALQESIPSNGKQFRTQSGMASTLTVVGHGWWFWLNLIHLPWSSFRAFSPSIWLSLFEFVSKVKLE